jgi:hypothetical protein
MGATFTDICRSGHGRLNANQVFYDHKTPGKGRDLTAVGIIHYQQVIPRFGPGEVFIGQSELIIHKRGSGFERILKIVYALTGEALEVFQFGKIRGAPVFVAVDDPISIIPGVGGEVIKDEGELLATAQPNNGIADKHIAQKEFDGFDIVQVDMIFIKKGRILCAGNEPVQQAKEQ